MYLFFTLCPPHPIPFLTAAAPAAGGAKAAVVEEKEEEKEEEVDAGVGGLFGEETIIPFIYV